MLNQVGTSADNKTASGPGGRHLINRNLHKHDLTKETTSRFNSQNSAQVKNMFIQNNAGKSQDPLNKNNEDIKNK